MPEIYEKDGERIANLKLGDEVKPTMVVQVLCDRCRRADPLDLVALLDRYGRETRLAEIAPRLRCRQCRARGHVTQVARLIGS